MIASGNDLRLSSIRWDDTHQEERPPVVESVSFGWGLFSVSFGDFELIIRPYRPRVIPDEAPPDETWDEWLDRSQKQAAKNREWNR